MSNTNNFNFLIANFQFRYFFSLPMWNSFDFAFFFTKPDCFISKSTKFDCCQIFYYGNYYSMRTSLSASQYTYTHHHFELVAYYAI